ncbi:MAG: hypothetical protein Q9M82_04675 [Mariprofundus sp.]|nr:hypothetical protein [Mariprofundus sp.]
MKAVRFAVTLKWLGVNILRASACQKGENGTNNPDPAGMKRLIPRIWAWMRPINDSSRCSSERFPLTPLETNDAIKMAV